MGSWRVESSRSAQLGNTNLPHLLCHSSQVQCIQISKPVSLVILLVGADFVATLALGNLLNTLNHDNNSGNSDLLAFWSPFFLHFGGPDTITAYSLHDNELPWTHFLGLILQLAIAIAVFFQCQALDCGKQQFLYTLLEFSSTECEQGR